MIIRDERFWRRRSGFRERIWGVVPSEGWYSVVPGVFSKRDDRGVGELGKKEVRLDGYEFSQTFRSAGTPFLPKVVKIEAEGRLKLCFLQSRFLLSIQFLIFPFFIWNLTFEQQHNSFEEVTNYN